LKVAKWGNSIAVRIPSDVVEKLGISPNEEVEIRITGENSFEVRRDTLPEGYRFNREELYDRFDRSVLGRSLALAASESSDEDQGAQ